MDEQELQRLIIEDANPDPYKPMQTVQTFVVQGEEPEDRTENHKMTEDEYILSLAKEAHDKINLLISNKLNLQGVDFEISREIIMNLLSIITTVDNNNQTITDMMDHINNAARYNQTGMLCL